MIKGDNRSDEDYRLQKLSRSEEGLLNRED